MGSLPYHLQQVQSGVEIYINDKKSLPYKYHADKYKFTTCYLVDFKALAENMDIPPSAFEMGGPFLYVLIDVEKKPKVRLFDLRINNEVTKIQQIVDQFKKEKERIPKKDQVASHLYFLDFHLLGIKPVTIPNPYIPGSDLPLLVDDRGKIYIDYRTAVMMLVQKEKKMPPENQDLRNWLAEQSMFVSAFSYPLRWIKNEPIFYLFPEK